MAFAIPRIQYKNVDTTGDTASGNGTILNIADITDVEVGMFIRGSNIPTGALVGSLGATSVTLASSVLATGNASGEAISFGYEILFDYPAVEDNGESLNTNQTTSTSLSGIRQVSVNFIEGTRDLLLSFLSPAVYALVNTFLQYALLGNSFRWYDDQASGSYVDVELATLQVTPVKRFSRTATTYVWDVPLTLRRVL